MVNENKIRILYVQPGKYPEERFVANEVHPLQRLVGGYMQAVYPWSKDKVALVCNDSGKVDGLPLNRCIEDYDVIAGNFFICGFSGEEFCSLTDKQFRHYEKLFRDPELFLSLIHISIPSTNRRICTPLSAASCSAPKINFPLSSD